MNREVRRSVVRQQGDQAADKPLESTHTLVDRNGQMHTEAWAERHEYGALLGLEQLDAEAAPRGLS